MTGYSSAQPAGELKWGEKVTLELEEYDHLYVKDTSAEPTTPPTLPEVYILTITLAYPQHQEAIALNPGTEWTQQLLKDQKRVTISIEKETNHPTLKILYRLEKAK